MEQYLKNNFSQMKVFEADGTDLLDIHSKTQQAIENCRSNQQPTLIVYKKLPRRFGKQLS